MKFNKSLVLIGIILVSIALLAAYFLVKNSALNKLQDQARTQLLQVINKLEITLERHAYLPALVADDQKIIQFMRDYQQSGKIKNKARQGEINISLELTNNTSGASAIFVMDMAGTTVASSNWGTAHSFIGKNFGFRPYFQQAKQNILGRYYAVGAVSGERGYFFARAIHDHGAAVGVVVVKVAMDEVEFTWGLGSMDFMVTDQRGVVFLSSQKSWNLHTLTALSAEQQQLIKQNRRYGIKPLRSLGVQGIRLAQHSFQKVTLQKEGKTKHYEMLSRHMELAAWDVRVLADYAVMEQYIVTAMAASSLVILLLMSLATLLWKTQQQRKQYQRQIQEELENKVVERTKALKQTQEELIQAAKMAALGQLSAGITHEINNPLTAIRSYADNASQFLKKDRVDMVASNLEEITRLTESMGAITKQLKSFSRKSKGQLTPVLLGQSIDNALSIVHPNMVRSQVICHWDNQGHGAHKSVLADGVWLGQILVNLFSNAITATQHKQPRKIWINIKTQADSMLCVAVRDNGDGIEEGTMPHIFEPFFTTKSSAKGLGLGLSISFNLAKDMNGSLNAKNNQQNGKQAGAVFILCLPEAGNPA